MSTAKIAILVAAVVALAGLVACNDKDRDEQDGASKAVTGRQTAPQKPTQKPGADEGEEGEEGPAIPAAVGAEKPVPHQNSPRPPSKRRLVAIVFFIDAAYTTKAITTGESQSATSHADSPRFVGEETYATAA